MRKSKLLFTGDQKRSHLFSMPCLTSVAFGGRWGRRDQSDPRGQPARAEMLVLLALGENPAQKDQPDPRVTGENAAQTA